MAEARALARQYAPDAMRVFYDILMNSDNDKTRIQAGKEILDRAYGRPHQSVSIDDPRKMSDSTLASKTWERINYYKSLN